MKIFKVGYCTQIEKFACKTSPFKKVKFWACAFLIKIPGHGNVLVDTGYGTHFFEATARFPYRLYRFLTPVKLEKDLRSQLKGEKIDYVVVTHFHPDHIGGLKDFQNSKWIYSAKGYAKMKALKGFKALREGMIPGLLPKSVPLGSMEIEEKEEKVFPFSPDFPSVDLFGDGSLFVFELPGHAIGQLGVAFRRGKKWTLLVADAAWSGQALKEGILPSYFGLKMQHDCAVYQETFWKLHKLTSNNDHIEVIATHGE